MRSRLLRLFGLTLLLMAVSPVTEPFATFDIADLFGEPGTPTSTTLKSPKTAADQPVPAIGSSDAARPASVDGSEPSAQRSDPRDASANTHRQLRI